MHLLKWASERVKTLYSDFIQQNATCVIPYDKHSIFERKSISLCQFYFLWSTHFFYLSKYFGV